MTGATWANEGAAANSNKLEIQRIAAMILDRSGNVHKLTDHIPGGAADVKSNWVGDQLNLDITAMGQTVAAQIDVQEAKVRCRVMLPGMLALFAAPIEAALNRKGSDLLLEDRSKTR